MFSIVNAVYGLVIPVFGFIEYSLCLQCSVRDSCFTEIPSEQDLLSLWSLEFITLRLIISYQNVFCLFFSELHSRKGAACYKLMGIHVSTGRQLQSFS